MSQVGSPPATVRPAAGTPAVTNAAVTPTPTDQATGNAPRHHGAGGQPAPQQQPAPQPPAPPTPAVTLSGALTALFAGQPVKANVTASTDGELVLQLPEAQLVLASKAIEAARGDVLVLKLVASDPTPTIVVTGRNGRPLADPLPVTVTVEPIPEQPAAVLVPPRRPLPGAAQILPPTVPAPSAPAPSAPGVPLPQPVPAAPSTAAAPPPHPMAAHAAELDLPPPALDQPTDHSTPTETRGAGSSAQSAQTTRPVVSTPGGMPAPATREGPTNPTETRTAASQGSPSVADPLSPAAIPARGGPMDTRASREAGSHAQASAARGALPPIAVASADTARAEDGAGPILPSRPTGPGASAEFTPTAPLIRQAASRPVPFVPPALPPDAPRASAPAPYAAPPAGTARPAATPVQTAIATEAAPVAEPIPARPPASQTSPSRPSPAARSQPAAPAAPPAATVSEEATAKTTAAGAAPIEIGPVPPEDAPLDLRVASAWSALWAVARTDTIVAERIRDMLRPAAGGRLAGGLAFLVAALRGGRLADWLGAADGARIDLPSRPDRRRTADAEFRDLARMAQERGPDGWRATPLAVYDAGAVQPVMLYVHRPPRRRKSDPGPNEAAERFMLDLKLSRAGPMRIDGLLRLKALDIIVRTERAVPGRIQREMRQVFNTSLEGAGLGGSLGFQTVDRLPPPPAMTGDGKPHHAVLA